MDFILTAIEGSEGTIAFVIFFMNMLGAFLKNKTKIKNDYIPLVLFGVGLVSGFFVVDMSVYGIIAGVVCAFTATGVHQGVKTTKNLISGESTIDEQQIEDNDKHDKI